MGDEGIVAEVGTVKRSAHDLADVDHASDLPGHPEDDESGVARDEIAFAEQAFEFGVVGE